MGSITTGVGLISGIDTANLIEQLLLLRAQPKIPLEARLINLQAQQTAMLDVNARLLNLQNAAVALREGDVFNATLATSSNEERVLATTGNRAQPGTYTFVVKQLVSTSQRLSQGYADANTTPLGLSNLGFEFGQARLSKDRQLEDLNAGAGVARGTISITDRNGNSESIDLTDVVTLDEVIERINDATTINVTASAGGDGLVITDNTGSTTSNLIVENVGSSTTATDLGIEQNVAADSITGTAINTLGLNTSLSSLNDGNGVLILDSNPDFTITDSAGNSVDIDLGRIDLPITDSTDLDELNNGAGVTFTVGDPDFIIDVAGTDVEINLGDVLDEDDEVVENAVTTVGELRTRINDALSDAGFSDITIEINATGDGFNIVDTGANGTIDVEGAGSNGTETASDLGFGSVLAASGTINGDKIPALVDKARTSSLQEVVDRINEQAAGAGTPVLVTAAIAADGLRLELTDTASGGGNTIVTAGSQNAYAARQLGLETTPTGVAGGTVTGTRLIAGLGTVLSQSIQGGNGANGIRNDTLLTELNGGAGITTTGDVNPDLTFTDRNGVSYDVDIDGLTTVGELIDAVNTATGGEIELSVEGSNFVVSDTTFGSTSDLQVASAGGSTTATDLGIELQVAAPRLVGTSVGTNLLNITDRAGNTTAIDISSFENLSEIVDAINADATIDVTVSLNDTQNGLNLVDNTGATASNLIITGTVAQNLGLATDAAGTTDTTIRGANVQLQYVSVSSRLSDLNFGRGVGTGSFTITDGLGESSTVNIDSDSTTLYDVIQEINSRGLAVRAEVNENGDGIVIRQDDAALGGTEPFLPISIVSSGGSVAADLRILGESESVDNASIEGSYEVVVDLDTSDSLNEVVSKINAAGVPVSASVLNTASGGTPFRLSLTSEISGANGELVIDTDGVDLGLTSISQGRDAKVFFGSSNPEEAFLLSSDTNSLDGVIQDVTIDLLQAGDEAVTISVARDTDSVVASVNAFVAGFNDAIERINQYDFFNTETEERGVLLGDPTLINTRSTLYQTLLRSAEGIGTQFTRLSQIGIRIGANARLEFDEAKFRSTLADDREGVVNLFTAFEQQTGTEETIAPGVTVTRDETTTTTAGIGRIWEEFLTSLTDNITGTFKRADERILGQIELTRDRIATIDQRVESERARLEAQFVQLEVALAGLQEQGAALGGISVPQI
ncbi:MAG: flagellar filament capping protein FliD [Planctomycetota bacterium]